MAPFFEPWFSLSFITFIEFLKVNSCNITSQCLNQTFFHDPTFIKKKQKMNWQKICQLTHFWHSRGAKISMWEGVQGSICSRTSWFYTIFKSFTPLGLFLGAKYAYLHFYLVPTRLLIWEYFSHLCVYLVPTLIQ